MHELVDAILSKNLTLAESLLESEFKTIMQKKLFERKKAIAAQLYEGDDVDITDLDEAMRIKIVRARIRNGKVQRRKRVANVPGFTLRSGKLTRMSPAERRRRKLGQRRGKIKRRAKRVQINRKRDKSMRKRKALGI